MKLLVLLSFFLVGCSLPEEPQVQNKNAPDGLSRFYDRDTGVVCYLYNQKALSCIKIR